MTAFSGVGLAAPSTIPSNDGTVRLCYNLSEATSRNGGAALRIYDTGINAKKCKSGDKKLTINQQGPRGLRGPAGDPANKVLSLEWNANQSGAGTLPASALFSGSGPATIARVDGNTWSVTFPAGTFPTSGGVGAQPGCPVPQAGLVLAPAGIVARVVGNACGTTGGPYPKPGGAYVVIDVDGAVDFDNDSFYMTLIDVAPR
ncbi:MAG TPA: hypothetical protein VNC22_13130 [Sporichthya sp.]|nr:hypothetical protein [Sporichthya sp.]